MRVQSVTADIAKRTCRREQWRLDWRDGIRRGDRVAVLDAGRRKLASQNDHHGYGDWCGPYIASQAPVLRVVTQE